MAASQTILGMNKASLFQAFKYGVYLLITVNVALFWREDYLASQHTFRGGMNWDSIYTAYATTIDSSAWLILLLLFEYETFIVEDENFKGFLKGIVKFSSWICFGLILLAAAGYYDQFLIVDAFAPTTYSAACAAVGQIQSYAVDFSDYHALTAANCGSAGSGPIFVHAGNGVLATGDTLLRMRHLALTDVVNSIAWIVLVIVLEIEIMLQFGRSLSKRLTILARYIKGTLYIALLAAAIYWGYLSALLDFWDAFLWIVAFVFIEMNMLEWAEEVEAETKTASERQTI